MDAALDRSQYGNAFSQTVPLAQAMRQDIGGHNPRCLPTSTY
jgi:hypothetical protein